MSNSISNIRPLDYSAEEKRDWTPEMHAHHKRLMANAVFGEDHKVDSKGRPIQQGIGSAGNMTPQARAALAKHEAEQAQLKKDAGIK